MKHTKHPGKRAIKTAEIAKPIPKSAGTYYWSEYGCNVEVRRKRGSPHLYVTPPMRGGVEIRITPRIAGVFLEAKGVHL